jgi:hypothetical protein
VAVAGDAQWYGPDPEGHFTYLEFKVDAIAYNVTSAALDAANRASKDHRVRSPTTLSCRRLQRGSDDTSPRAWRPGGTTPPNGQDWFPRDRWWRRWPRTRLPQRVPTSPALRRRSLTRAQRAARDEDGGTAQR